MTAIASAMQQKFRGGAVGFRAASARSEKIEFTDWADCVEKLVGFGVSKRTIALIYFGCP
ncbi:hypothetical protein [Antarctobacter heliothermus]|uniref:hypothetical protein n=1 Tax=Antarctobacter heliothermus TaxID=74033 RepID=UPI00112FE9A2|nr:hypothetical protein [Antarctobacter heliothermus]